MKKIVLSILMGVIMSCVFCTTCFATGSENITFSCYTTTSLTKNIILKANSSITINWGDGNTTTDSIEGTEKTFSHTYSTTGTYEVSISTDNITALKISDNDIFDIDLSQVINLKELDLSNNKLEALDLTNNTALESLRISNNYLKSLKIVSNMITLLDCSSNNLTSLEIPNAITELYFNNNEVSNIDLSGFSGLTILECSDNNISNLVLTDCSELKTLKCSNNFITELSLTGNPKLTVVSCYGNELQALDINNNIALQELNCLGNKLTALDVSNNTNLQELYIFKNEISSIDLNNIALTRVITDSTTTISNNLATTLIKLEIAGNGGAELNSNKEIAFSSVPNKLLINDVEESDFGIILDVSGYIGAYNIKAVFSESIETEYMLLNTPKLLEGMIPVKHNGTNWVITNAEDSEWYNYNKSELKWANVMLRDDAYYLDLDNETLKSVGSTPLEDLIGRQVPESYTGSMYVWIPRFSYKISDSSIEIKYSQGFTDYIEDGYKTHPAFNYASYVGNDASDENNYVNLTNSDKYLGIWVAKYPAGKNISNPKYATNISEIQNVSIGDAFLASKLTASSSTYGLTDATSHLIKNTEWGAVAYFTTAVGNLGNNSSTGNIYGIFGMNDTAEYVSSFVELVGGISNFNVRKNGKTLLPYNIVSYSDYDVADIRDIEVFKLKSTEDNASSNYSILSEFYGIGISEVNTNITGNITNNVPYGSNAFLIRGVDGIYSYSGSTGYGSNIGFRNVILRASGSNLDVSEDTYTETFIIKSSAEEGGKISPLGNTTVQKGKNITYSVIPDEGCEVIDVLVDNVSVYKDLVNHTSYYTYTFSNVISDHKISVVFDTEVAPYEVIVNQNPENAGDITGEGTHNSRTTVTLVASGKSGYQFNGWEVIEGLDVNIDNDNSTISFKMPNNNVILQANFIEVLKAMLKVENLYGLVSMEKSVGVKVNISAGENDEYAFDSWSADGIVLTAEQLTSPSIEITMPSNDVNLLANYNKLYLLEVTLGDGTVVKTYQPETKTVTLTAPEIAGKTFKGWSVSGLESGLSSENAVSFTMPSNTVKITVLYE